MIPASHAELVAIDDDREFKALSPAVQTAYRRLWQVALPYGGRVTEATLLRLLRATAGASHVDLALEALLGAGLLCTDDPWPGTDRVYDLLTPSLRDGARVFAEAAESSELDELIFQETA